MDSAFSLPLCGENKQAFLLLFISPQSRRDKEFRRELLLVQDVLFLFTDMEDPGNIEAQADISITP